MVLYCGNQGAAPKKAQHKFLYDLAVLLQDIYPKGLKTGTQPVCSWVFIDIARRWKQPKRPSVDEQMNKLADTKSSVICPSEEDILTHATQ